VTSPENVQRTVHSKKRILGDCLPPELVQCLIFEWRSLPSIMVDIELLSLLLEDINFIRELIISLVQTNGTFPK